MTNIISCQPLHKWLEYATRDTRRTVATPEWRRAKSKRARELWARAEACAAGKGYEIVDGKVCAWRGCDKHGCNGLVTKRNIYPTLIAIR